MDMTVYNDYNTIIAQKGYNDDNTTIVQKRFNDDNEKGVQSSDNCVGWI